MSVNTAIITEGAAASAVQHMNEYSDGVAAHFNGDWGGHNQVKVIDEVFMSLDGSTIPNSKKLRITVTLNGVEHAVLVPIIPFSTAVSADVPAITVHPVGGKATLGGAFRMTVRVTGAVPLTYQWHKNEVPIAGAVSRDFTLTNVRLSSAGNYTVLVRNSNGVAISNIAVVQVTTTVVAEAAESGGFDWFGVLTGTFPLT